MQESSCVVLKVVGAILAVVSLMEFVWYSTMSSNEKVLDRGVPTENVDDDRPLPVYLMAALIQMVTFVSCRSVCHFGSFFLHHLLSASILLLD